MRRTRDEGAIVITLRQIKYAVIGFGVLVAAAVPAAALAADPDWKAVEQAWASQDRYNRAMSSASACPHGPHVTVKGIP